MNLSIDRDALQQPGWAEGLRTAWRELSLVLRPFYGDVRTTHGHGRSRNGRWWTAGGTERHPVRSWWWAGVPARLGHAAVVGAPYLEAWPDFAKSATICKGLAFVSTDDWASPNDASAIIGGVPTRLALLPSDDYPTEYPSTFPFIRV